MHVPATLHTERMLLRAWRAEDATDLAPILDVNYDHLGPWIPPRVSTPAPVPALAARLQQFADDFAASKEWRYAMRTHDEGTLLGEISVFPRSPDARVPYHDADRVEIGYWLRKDMTGRGLVTEAVRATITMLSRDPRYTCIEIRCDERNAPSGAIPARLGFTLTRTIPGDDGTLQVWTQSITSA